MGNSWELLPALIDLSCTPKINICQEFGNTTTEGKMVEGPEQKDMYRKFTHKTADFPCLLENAEIPRCPEGWKSEGYSLKNGKKNWLGKTRMANVGADAPELSLLPSRPPESHPVPQLLSLERNLPSNNFIHVPCSDSIQTFCYCFFCFSSCIVL